MWHGNMRQPALSGALKGNEDNHRFPALLIHLQDKKACLLDMAGEPYAMCRTSSGCPAVGLLILLLLVRG